MMGEDYPAQSAMEKEIVTAQLSQVGVGEVTNTFGLSSCKKILYKRATSRVLKRRAMVFLVVIFLAVVLIPSVTNAEPSQWESVGEGIEYRVYYLDDPNIVYVTRMDRQNPNVTIETSIALGKLSSGLETMSNQAKRYDEALNNWGQALIPHETGGWGARNQVVVAINGTFTLFPGSQQPWEGQVHSGWYAWRFQDTATRNAFTWKLDRSVFIGDCVRHPAGKQLVHYTISNTQEITGINETRGDDELILYTPQYDRDTKTDDSGVEVLVEMTNPTLINHPEQAVGTVREIRSGQGSTLIPFDHVVLSAAGTAANQLESSVQVGTQIGISQFIRNCDSESTLDWSNTFASIVSNDFYFLKDGQYQYNSDLGANVRNPRTAVAYNEHYVYFIVVDGRYPERSIGMTIEHLADFSKNLLQADHGLSLDGGGSSTMVVNGEVKNFPSDGVPGSAVVSGLEDKHLIRDLSRTRTLIESPDSSLIFLPVLQNNYPIDIGDPPPYPIVERGVPNGLMMVVILPKEQSSGFQAGDDVVVQVSGNANLRLGPGTNYHVIDSIPNATSGFVLDPTNALNGVRAKGYYWWKVNFGNLDGWMAGTLLSSP